MNHTQNLRPFNPLNLRGSDNFHELSIKSSQFNHQYPISVSTQIYYLFLLRLAASRVLRFFSSCLFSKYLLLLHSCITPVLITSLLNRFTSLSSDSLSSTNTCTLYPELKRVCWSKQARGKSRKQAQRKVKKRLKKILRPPLIR